VKTRRKISLTAVATEEKAEELRRALAQVAEGAEWSRCEIGSISGPPVAVVGVWDVREPVLGLDFYIHYRVVELELGERLRIRLVGRVLDENVFPQEHDWQVPEGVGELLGCDEEVAAELLTRLAAQALAEFEPVPWHERIPLEAEIF